jgi:hypothetical protein
MARDLSSLIGELAALKGAPTGGTPVDTIHSSVFRPNEADEDTHPHACTAGLVFLTHTVFDEEIGEEVERLEVVPCRRCADSR